MSPNAHSKLNRTLTIDLEKANAKKLLKTTRMLEYQVAIPPAFATNSTPPSFTDKALESPKVAARKKRRKRI